jgi:hypothetical protein
MGLKSPLDGRWDGRGRTGSCDEPVHREEEGHPHQDVLTETMAYGDQPLTDGTLT